MTLDENIEVSVRLVSEDGETGTLTIEGPVDILDLIALMVAVAFINEGDDESSAGVDVEAA